MSLGAALCGVLVSAFLVPLPERLGEDPSPVLLDRQGEVLHVALAPDQRWRIATRLDRVDPDYIEALLTLEDRRFFYHPGVDPLAVVRALLSNLRAGRIVSGGSTLTLQLVRMVEPRPRTYTSKIIEMLRAFQIELRMSKQEILEAYLRFLPYGGNVEGLETGAFALFGHSAEALSTAEISLLLAIPQDPNARRPTVGRETALREARLVVFERLVWGGRYGGPDSAQAEAERQAVEASFLPKSLQAMPRGAPHVALSLLHQGRSTSPRETTLSAATQRTVERLTAGIRAEAKRNAVNHVAVVVVDHQTGALEALVGGFDASLDTPGGQIPAFSAPRSPGSALKPLLYAMAIDRGMVLPESLVRDIPQRFGSYQPQNYDGSWSGVVRLEEALSQSLNLPFVELLGRLGVSNFVEALRGAGANSLSERPGEYGLSAVVGGIAVTPIELAGLYTGLAPGGKVLRPHLEPGDGGETGGLWREGAAFLTRRALRVRDRPDFPSRRLVARTPRELAWKTGTSFGNRDAWAVGIGVRRVVVVWLGNLDQRGSPWLVGAEAAGPLLFDILEALKEGLEAAEEPSADLVEIPLCPLSGLPPGRACPGRMMGLALAQAVPRDSCSLHRSIEVDTESGLRRLPGCRDGHSLRKEILVDWPSEVRQFLGERWGNLPTVPPLAPDCEPHTGRAPPRIVAPEREATLMLIPGLDARAQEVALRASAGEGPLEWFVNGRFVGRADPGEAVWWAPQVGRHPIVVVDAAGRSDRLELVVRTGDGAPAP
jgi:penicillin-binding protein 1C